MKITILAFNPLQIEVPEEAMHDEHIAGEVGLTLPPTNIVVERVNLDHILKEFMFDDMLEKGVSGEYTSEVPYEWTWDIPPREDCKMDFTIIDLIAIVVRGQESLYKAWLALQRIADEHGPLIKPEEEE